ncbi:MAG: hypothetical protein LBC84_05675 [Prevotellaceae bacterium]|jgi:hypothetical protein|nr:hypothetical protein [Prevotellaceae bacterium]
MRRTILLLTIALLAGTSFVPESGSPIYSPVFISRESLENSVRYIPGARDMIQTGKIYYNAPYIYVNERYKGVHIINNTNPTRPVNEGFIFAPGCIDMAAKGNILYLDNAVDLVSINLDNKQITKRIRNVFPEPLPPDDFSHFRFSRPEGYVLVEWKRTNR